MSAGPRTLISISYFIYFILCSHNFHAGLGNIHITVYVGFAT